MRALWRVFPAAILCVVMAAAAGICQDQVQLPPGVKAVWAPEQGTPRYNLHPRAPLDQRPLAVAAGQGQERPAADGKLGLLQGPRLLAGSRRLHAERLSDGLSPSELEERQTGRHYDGLVSARNQHAEGVDRPPYRRDRRILEFRGRGLRGRQEGRPDAVSGGRSGPHLDVPAGQQARAQHGGDRPTAGRRRGRLQRQQRASEGEGIGSAARPVRRRLSRRCADRPADRRRESRHLGAQRRDHVPRGIAGPRSERPIYPSCCDHRKRQAGHGVHEQGVQGKQPQGRPHRRYGEVEARETLGHPHAAEHLRRGRFAGGGRRQTAGRGPARAFRVPRVLDRWPGFLLERQPHLALVRPAGQCPDRGRAGQLQGREGELAAAQGKRHQLRLHAQLRLQSGLVHQLRRDFAGRGRRRGARFLLAAAQRPLRLESVRRRQGQRLRPSCGISRARCAEPSVGRVLLHEPQRHRLYR